MSTPARNSQSTIIRKNKHPLYIDIARRIVRTVPRPQAGGMKSNPGRSVYLVEDLDGNPFADLLKQFMRAGQPQMKKLVGWHAGRCFHEDRPRTPKGGLLLFFQLAKFPNVPVFMEMTSWARPNFFDHLNDPSRDKWAKDKHREINDVFFTGKNSYERLSAQDGSLEVSSHAGGGKFRYKLRTTKKGYLLYVDFVREQKTMLCRFDKKVH